MHIHIPATPDTVIDRATNINDSMYIDHEMRKVRDYYGGYYDPLLAGYAAAAGYGSNRPGKKSP